MLILIAGITGNLGKHLARVGLEKGHQVRGLGRSPDKLDDKTKDQLESFVVSSSYYDTPALDRAMIGVAAVICAYSGRPELVLDGNLLLLRAAERAGIKIYLASSWNVDWRHVRFGDHESFNPFLSFRQQVAITSAMKPIWIFTGVLAEVFFSVPGHGDLSPKNHGIWDPAAKTIDLWGTGREKFDWTTEANAAEFSIAIIESPEASQGGFYSVRSGCHSLREIKAVYERVRGSEVKLIEKGSVEELEKTALQARARGSLLAFWEYIGYFYQLVTIDGSAVLRNLDNDRFPDVKPTGLEEFLRQTPEV
ncbi:NAD(P)-binding protein [Penicillium concentricum]|uniref:NAD(P)-binding protein n=1 Tax=Penicillium concentricum TaxID=293559 RepID=A0A9W9RBL2_9EURO|nr:NAD(P)-binding protein [Penicillium concentricum]KAJ5355849.1 NAD(P)-binding protein [Penicillium concentricum]